MYLKYILICVLCIFSTTFCCMCIIFIKSYRAEYSTFFKFLSIFYNNYKNFSENTNTLLYLVFQIHLLKFMYLR